jgi:hypothetical protein
VKPRRDGRPAYAEHLSRLGLTQPIPRDQQQQLTITLSEGGKGAQDCVIYRARLWRTENFLEATLERSGTPI